MLKRTHTCGQLRAEHVGQTVTLSGWVNTYRDQGKGLSFVDLRDRDGLTQVVFDQEETVPEVVKEARTLRREDVIAITGDPLSDVTLLESVRFVMKDGLVVRDDFSLR